MSDEPLLSSRLHRARDTSAELMEDLRSPRLSLTPWLAPNTCLIFLRGSSTRAAR